ncbi:hypothetical protein BsWGS_03795 [Bradybaena similaris]
MTSRALTSGLFFIFLIVSFCRPMSATMDITAFEYQRKFHKPLDLGECSQREVTVDLGNNTFHTEEQRCTLHQRGAVTHLPRELNDSRNVLITSAQAIVNYLGLCGGEAASFLGILNSGDCVAIEIASQLTFSNKTMIRAFVGYYRKSLDILEESNGPLDGMDIYYKDKFYLKNRSYGTLEIIFVQFRFDTVRATEEAKKIVLNTPMMSAYMTEVERKIGTPKNIVVISLSTATQETYNLRQFKKEEWERGLRFVEILELTIQKTRHQINTNAIMPHLQYQLHPFVDSGDYRLIKPLLWEQTSMLEVQLRQALILIKKTAKKCRKNKSQLCIRVRGMRSELEKTQAEVHKGRSNWVNLTVDQKNQFATNFTSKVSAYTSLTKKFAKQVNEMKKKEKFEKLERKMNQINQIPVDTEGQPPKRQHRIRHAKSRNRHRNGQGR